MTSKILKPVKIDILRIHIKLYIPIFNLRKKLRDLVWWWGICLACARSLIKSLPLPKNTKITFIKKKMCLLIIKLGSLVLWGEDTESDFYSNKQIIKVEVVKKNKKYNCIFLEIFFKACYVLCLEVMQERITPSLLHWWALSEYLCVNPKTAWSFVSCLALGTEMGAPSLLSKGLTELWPRISLHFLFWERISLTCPRWPYNLKTLELSIFSPKVFSVMLTRALKCSFDLHTHEIPMLHTQLSDL